MMKATKDLTDDDIVGGLAIFGYGGIPVERLSSLAIRMDLDDWNGLEARLYNLYHRTDRVVRPNGDDHYALSNAEWGRRLAWRSADTITEMLHGESWT